jgi:hypothetical protein
VNPNPNEERRAELDAAAAKAAADRLLESAA